MKIKTLISTPYATTIMLTPHSFSGFHSKFSAFPIHRKLINKKELYGVLSCIEFLKERKWHWVMYLDIKCNTRMKHHKINCVSLPFPVNFIFYLCDVFSLYLFQAPRCLDYSSTMDLNVQWQKFLNAFGEVTMVYRYT